MNIKTKSLSKELWTDFEVEGAKSAIKHLYC